jgi:scyllo-inositol 2-dehydrogenase (NADP+)
MAKKKGLKAGVIGYGGAFNMGYQHLNEMARAGMTPVAVCDQDRSRLDAAEADFPGITTWKTAGRMLKNCDADLLTIITPHNTHAKLARQCLEAGRHVVVEKPMAITTAECDAMIAMAKKKKRLLSTYHNRHWDGCILQAVKMIRAGVIGEVFRAEINLRGYAKPQDWWRSRKSVSGGILFDWGVHMLEYTLQLMDAELTEVSGFMHSGHWAGEVPWSRDANEDEGAVVIRFEKGKWAKMIISDISCDRPRPWLEVTGTKGAYVMEHDTYAWTIAEGGEKITHSGHNPAGEGWRFYQNIADHLMKGRKLVITPEWARRPIHILDLACQSAKKGRALQVKYK